MKNLALMCCSVGSKFISYNTSSKCVELMVTKKGFREELEENLQSYRPRTVYKKDTGLMMQLPQWRVLKAKQDEFKGWNQ